MEINGFCNISSDVLKPKLQAYRKYIARKRSANFNKTLTRVYMNWKQPFYKRWLGYKFVKPDFAQLKIDILTAESLADLRSDSVIYKGTPNECFVHYPHIDYLIACHPLYVENYGWACLDWIEELESISNVSDQVYINSNCARKLGL